jgi:hypothetical protein
VRKGTPADWGAAAAASDSDMTPALAEPAQARKSERDPDHLNLRTGASFSLKPSLQAKSFGFLVFLSIFLCFLVTLLVSRVMPALRDTPRLVVYPMHCFQEGGREVTGWVL